MSKNEINEYVTINALSSKDSQSVTKFDSKKYQSLIFFSSNDQNIIINEFNLSLNKIESPSNFKIDQNCTIKKIFSRFLDSNLKTYSLIVCENLNLLMIDAIVYLFIKI